MSAQPSIACNRGVDLYNRGDLQGAEASFQEALRTDPKYVHAHNNLGNVKKARGDLEGAEASYQEALRLDPKRVNAHNNLGNVKMARGDLEGAEASFQEALRLDPRSVNAHIVLGTVKQNRGDLDGAEAFFQEALRLDPKCVHAHNNLGNVKMARGDLEGAEASYQEALRLDPRSVNAHIALGRVKQNRGDLDGAEASCQEALRLDPKCVHAHNDLGNVKMARGDLEGAEASCQEALRLDPKSVTAHILLGYVKKARGDLEGAEASCQEALRLDPKSVPAHILLGYVKKDRGDLEGAEASCQEALRTDPKSVTAHNNLGYVKQARGFSQGAEASHQEAVRLDPKSVSARFGLGGAKEHGGDLEGALEAYNACLRLDPTYSLALIGRASVKAKKYDLNDALQDASAAIALRPGAHFFEVRGRVNMDLGNYEEALLDYGEALNRSRGQPVYLRRQAALKELMANKAEIVGDTSSAQRLRDESKGDLAAAHASNEPGWLAEGCLIGPDPKKYSLDFAPFRVAYQAAPVPGTRAELKRAIERMFQEQGSTDANAFFAVVSMQMDEHPNDSVADAAERFWTSALTNQQLREPCSMLSECVRFTPETILGDMEKARAAAIVARALNLNLEMNRLQGVTAFFPPGGMTLRGSSLPNQHVGWFMQHNGHKIRMPNYFATAVETTPSVSFQFMCRAQSEGKKPALWKIQFDQRGDPSDANASSYGNRYACKNMNLIRKRVNGLPDEHELLFVAYSVFTIVSVVPSTNPTPNNPHEIILEAAVDNADEPDDLPLAPWS